MVFCAMLVYLSSIPQRNPTERSFGGKLDPLFTAAGAEALVFYFLTWWCAAIVLLVVATIYLAEIGEYAAERDY